jgi:hypothetical protein
VGWWVADVNSDRLRRHIMTITVEALLHERRGYEMRGLTDRVALVDAEIERLAGVKVETVVEAPRNFDPNSAVEFGGVDPVVYKQGDASPLDVYVTVDDEVETGEADADADLETADAAPAKGRRRS